jgi:hypothetical protein
MLTISDDEYYRRKREKLPTILIDVRQAEETRQFSLIDPHQAVPLSAHVFAAKRLSQLEMTDNVLQILKTFCAEHPDALVVVACTRTLRDSARTQPMCDLLESNGIAAKALVGGLYAVIYHGLYDLQNLPKLVFIQPNAQ